MIRFKLSSFGGLITKGNFSIFLQRMSLYFTEKTKGLVHTAQIFNQRQVRFKS